MKPSHARSLEAETISTPDGNLDCSGISARKTTERDGVTIEENYTIRLNDRIPFGVVTLELSSDAKQNGQVVGTTKIQATIVEFGTDATSLLPDANQDRQPVLSQVHSPGIAVL